MSREEGEDAKHHGIPVYTVYMLEEIRPDGSCMLYNSDSRERFPCRHLYEINIDWLVTVWERYLELCVGQKLWKQNAVAFLKESTDKMEAEISAFVDSGWDKCSAYTDNLKRFLGKDEAKEVWVFSFLWMISDGTLLTRRSFSITKTIRIQRLKR